MSYFHNIAAALAAASPGGPVHVKPHMAIGDKIGRIVAIRAGDTWDHRTKEATYNLSFSDSKVDLRKDGGDTLYNVPRRKVIKTIAAFFDGTRTDEGNNGFEQFINQAVRECWVTKITPTRCRIEYELPNSGIVGAWRSQTTVGGFTYIASW